jgi:hypothetical protein
MCFVPTSLPTDHRDKAFGLNNPARRCIGAKSFSDRQVVTIAAIDDHWKNSKSGEVLQS